MEPMSSGERRGISAGRYRRATRPGGVRRGGVIPIHEAQQRAAGGPAGNGHRMTILWLHDLLRRPRQACSGQGMGLSPIIRENLAGRGSMASMTGARAATPQGVNRPLVRLRGISKSYGNVAAVKPLDLEIHARDFLAILGPSGCGKTRSEERR